MTQHAPRPRRTTLSAVAVLLAAAGCEPPPEEIELGVCGNGVLDRRGDDPLGDPLEDCEPAVHGESCYGRGHPNQCRFKCTPGDDATCPADGNGWGCGADGVCRLPRRDFAPPIEVYEPGESWMALADFDGDGREDIATMSAIELAIHYLDPTGTDVEESSTLPVLPWFGLAKAVVGRVDPDDELPDVIVPTPEGLVALRGSRQRGLVPTTFLRVHEQAEKLLAFGVELDGARDNGEELLALRGKGSSQVLLQYEPDGEVVELGAELDAGVGVIVVGDLGDAKPTAVAGAEELLMAVSDVPRVDVYAAKWVNGRVEPVKLSGSVTWDGARADRLMLAHLNPPGAPWGCATGAVDDEHIDLLIATDAGVPLHTAFGLGDATFASSPCPAEATAGVALPAFDPTEDQNDKCALRVLAVGSLDADPRLDFVTNCLLVMNGATSFLPVPLEAIGWSTAQIGELNGDAFPDVVGASPQGLVMMLGSEYGPTNVAQVATGGVSQVALGDYDGDGVGDVAFVEERGPDNRDVRIAFGAPYGPPTTVVTVGSVKRVESLAALDYPRIAGDSLKLVDTATDLAMTAVGVTEKAPGIALLRGRTDRHLQAAYALDYRWKEGSDAAAISVRYQPTVAAVGNFGFADGKSRTLLVAGVQDGDKDARPAPPSRTLAALEVKGADVLALLSKRPLSPAALAPTPDSEWSGTAFGASLPPSPGETSGVDHPLLAMTQQATASEDWSVLVMVPSFADATSPEGEQWKGGALEIPDAVLAGLIPTAFLDVTKPFFPNDVIAGHVGRSHAPLVSCRAAPGGGSVALLVLAASEPGSVDGFQMRLYAFHQALIDELAAGNHVPASTPDLQVMGAGDGRHVVGVACINADADPEQEVVLLTAPGAGTDLRLPDDARLELHLLDVGVDGRLPASLGPALRAFALRAADSAPLGLVGGDVNGDGVDDLVVASGSFLRILRGVPVLQ
jgi:hypothetical protein